MSETIEAVGGAPALKMRGSLSRMIGKRVAVGMGTLLLVSGAIYFGTNALPGNAVQVALGIRAGDPVLLDAAMAEAGLDRPVVVRYFEWLGGLFTGDLGTSLLTKMPIADLLAGRLLNTAILAGIIIVLLVPLAMGLGVWSALRKNRATDHTIAGVTLTLHAIPEFVVGTVLIVVFASWLGWLPGISLVNPSIPTIQQPMLLILPVLTTLTIAVGQGTRFIRATVSEILQSDYVQMARLRGIPTLELVWRHVLPNALGPAIQVFAFTVGSLVGGVVVTEQVFSYPGIGTLFVQSVASRDITTVATIAMLVSAAYIACNMLADILVLVFNPRLRRGGGFAK